ncbi:hypothetical protein BZZ01_12125 [Nostocales cyanobacterium HT-58-2]|nr:hypothetical protein BZZ01_12125 [Nostocales cyanobacterium HT-58-2]
MHHIICDAISGLHFIDHLLSYCQKIMAGEQISEVATMKTFPSFEELLSHSSLSNNNVEKAPGNFHQAIQPPLITEFFESQTSLSELHTYFLTRSLSQEMTVNLKNRCRQEGTTVHGALCAAMLFAAAKIAHVDTPVNLSCASSVSLRKYCEPQVPDDYLACVSDAMSYTHTLEKNTSFWDLARETKSKIIDAINSKTFVNSAEEQSEDVPDFTQNEQFREIMQRLMGRYASVFIANPGQLKIAGKYDVVKIKELYLPIGFHLAGPCFGLKVVTLHEQMFFTFSYVEPLISKKTSEIFADSVIDIIHQACLPQSFDLSEINKTEKENVDLLKA